MLLVVVSVASHAVDPIALVAKKVGAAVAKGRSLPAALGRRSRFRCQVTGRVGTPLRGVRSPMDLVIIEDV